MKINTQLLASSYIRSFNADDEENVIQKIPNAQAEDWLLERIPRIAVPDAEIERTYYFRWWTYRKHIKDTPSGCVVTEFHPDVRWAGRYNTIPCALGHHIREGRWLRENAFLDEYIRFWYLPETTHLRSYSNYFESAIGDLYRLRGEIPAEDLINAMAGNLDLWRRERMGSLGLYWSNDDRDGSEFSVTGPGLRLTLNSYQVAGLRTVAGFYSQTGKEERAEHYRKQSLDLRNALEQLWDSEKQFYIPIPQWNEHSPAFRDERRRARELFGYLPWAFHCAPEGRGNAFDSLLQPDGFAGRYGLTTVERSSSGFGLFYTGAELNAWLAARGEPAAGELGHECLWNGPSWPFATTFALTALANALALEGNAGQVTPRDYLALLHQYAAAHHRITENGRNISWIDENLNPDTGDWISRTRLKNWGGQVFPAEMGGYERGKDYNHSAFCDLVLEGLFGIRPGQDSIAIIPLFPADWEYAVLEDVPVHGHSISVHYDRGSGYTVESNGVRVFHFPVPTCCQLAF